MKKKKEVVAEAKDPIVIPEGHTIIQGKLVRVDADNGHWYQSDKDETYKRSLTYILDGGFPLTFGLKEFFQTHTKEEAQDILSETGLSGSKIHHTIYMMNLGHAVSPEGFTDEQIKFLGLSERELVNYLRLPFTKEEDVKLKGYKNFVKDFNPEIIEGERILISHKHDFGCTLDSYVKLEIPKDKRIYKEFAGKKAKAFIDYKSGKTIHYKGEIQVVMCGEAYRETTKTRKSKSDIYAILHLGVNKVGYRFKIVKDPKKAKEDFRTVQKAFELVGPDSEPRFYQFEPEYKIEKYAK